LFSRNEVAEFIAKSFEPVWVSVRPVPIVRIDFGNGHVLTRTLHGNIATCVCTAEGQVLDILPGVYQPEAYLAALDQLRLLPQYVNARGPAERDARLKEYHRTQAEALAKHGAAGKLIDISKMSKAKIESTIKLVLQPGPAPRPEAAATAPPPNFDSAEDIANRSLLAEDTRVNETQRRRLIHEMLAGAGAVQPDAIVKRLYKDVLHADLDDPYLGLGEVLFAHYPFAKEERR
jgi:hypothetical protein